MAQLVPNVLHRIVNKVALGGLNTYDDPKDIGENENADILNMVYDNGTILPRNGSLLYRAKPSGETSAPYQQIVATTSDGIDYQIINYGTNFWLDDAVNNQWVKINQIYTPPTAEMYYGSANWNAGITDDRIYFGNGKDNTMKWIMGMGYLDTTTASGDTSLSLEDTQRFPTEILLSTNVSISIATPAVITLTDHGLSAGDTVTFTTTGTLPTGITSGTTYYVIATGLTSDSFQISITSGGVALDTTGTQSGEHSLFLTTIPIIITNAGTSFVKYYNNNDTTTNTLTLTTTVGQIVPSGSNVTMPIFNMARMPKGKILRTFQTSRLVIANYIGKENTMNTSYFGYPEDNTIDGTVNTAVISTVNKGKGGIIGLDDFGEYLLIEKQDILIRYGFRYAADGSSFEPYADPIISGDSIGPVTSTTKLNYMNVLYYPTLVEGIISFAPTTTGSQTSSSLTILSNKIQNYVTRVLDFQNSRTAGWNQKLFWLTSTPLLGIRNGVNTGVIMYDLQRGVWSRFDNWNAADIKPANGNLYFLSLNDGAVYQTFTSGYQDAADSEPLAYNASFTTKRWDMESPAQQSTYTHIYLEGIISLETTFYVDVLYNDGGSLGKQTYEINGSNLNYTTNTVSGGLGYFPLGIPVLGGLSLEQMQRASEPAFFAVYLQLSQAYQPRNIQIKCYSNAIGSQWGVSSLDIMYLPKIGINTSLVLGPTLNPPILL